VIAAGWNRGAHPPRVLPTTPPSSVSVRHERNIQFGRQGKKFGARAHRTTAEAAELPEGRNVNHGLQDNTV
jgi:hypothetical protein